MSKLLVIGSTALCEGDFLDKISKLCKAGVDEILLREKELNENKFRLLAFKVDEICKKFNTKLVINQFFNIACELERSFWMSSKQLETLINLKTDEFGLNMRNLAEHKKQNLNAKIYAPAHTFDEALNSSKFADILVASHIFATNSKVGLEPKGVCFIKELKAKFDKEIYALGGINETNAKDILNAGVDGICTMSLAMRCEDEFKFVRNFKPL
ncbi:thiamine phosphate synthase [Campylobacter sp. 7477a]|uniref:thiamine phosphate synthase n=1 Tax=Campylobacter sp. 7477a TaxID=2735741 RepID=UPI0030148023|nr:thiamine phosphate synthase [Campylobacter sp. 7477a]